MNKIIATENGVTYERLTLLDIKPIQDQLLVQWLLNADIQSKEDKLNRQELYTVKLNLRNAPPVVGDVLAYANGSVGAMAILKLCLVKAKAIDADAIIAALPIPRAIEIARNLILEDAEQEPKSDFTTAPATTPIP